MKILVLAPYPPFPPHGGGSQRIFQLLRGLSMRHELTCLTFSPDAAADAALAPLREYATVEIVRGPTARGLPRRALTTLLSPMPDMALRNASRDFGERLSRLLRERQFDLVQAESIEMAGYAWLVRSLTAAQRQPPLLVLDQFNAEYLLQRRAFLTDLRRLNRLHAAVYSLIQWSKLARYERAVMRAFAAVVAVSQEDGKALARLERRLRIVEVPNGVDCAYFAPPDVRSSTARPQLIFTGTMDYRPNIDAVRWFVGEVLPLIRARLPEVELCIVGRAPAPAVLALAGEPGISVTGAVADVRPAIAAAAVYVVPMRIGGGIRLKLLEALAMEAPVVSTRMGAEGVRDLADGKHCLLADDANGFAAAVLRLLADPGLGRQLGSQGRKLVCAAYDWSAIVPQLEQAYARLHLAR